MTNSKSGIMDVNRTCTSMAKQKNKTEYKNNHKKTHCYIRNLKSNQEYHGPHSGPLKEESLETIRNI